MQVDVDGDGGLGHETRLASGMLLDGHLGGSLAELLAGLAGAASELAGVDGRTHGHAGEEKSGLDRHLGGGDKRNEAEKERQRI